MTLLVFGLIYSQPRVLPRSGLEATDIQFVTTGHNIGVVLYGLYSNTVSILS